MHQCKSTHVTRSRSAQKVFWNGKWLICLLYVGSRYYTRQCWGHFQHEDSKPLNWIANSGNYTSATANVNILITSRQKQPKAYCFSLSICLCLWLHRRCAKVPWRCTHKDWLTYFVHVYLARARRDWKFVLSLRKWCAGVEVTTLRNATVKMCFIFHVRNPCCTRNVARVYQIRILCINTNLN